MTKHECEYIPVNIPRIEPDDIEAVVATMRAGWISSEGPIVGEFESNLAKYCGREHGISCTNGTHALVLAIKSLNLPKNSYVICPSFTIISCAIAIIEAGCIPKFVDVNEYTFNVSCEQIESAIDANVSAVIVPHIYCYSAQMQKIELLCKEKGIYLIEDAAEMLGQEHVGRKCGSFGDVSCFSFYPNKQITTGEGGMVLTNDRKIAEKLRSIRNLCFKAEKRFYHTELGSNYRMTALQASLGNSQLKKINEIVKKKIELGVYYYENITKNEILRMSEPQYEGMKNIYWVFPLVFQSNFKNKRKFLDRLEEVKIGTRPFFQSLKGQPVFDGIDTGEDPCLVSKYLGENGFYIPSGLGMDSRQKEQVVNRINMIIAEFE